jgi:hypothetical protein
VGCCAAELMTDMRPGLWLGGGNISESVGTNEGDRPINRLRDEGLGSLFSALENSEIVMGTGAGKGEEKVRETG